MKGKSVKNRPLKAVPPEPAPVAAAEEFSVQERILITGVLSIVTVQSPLMGLQAKLLKEFGFEDEEEARRIGLTNTGQQWLWNPRAATPKAIRLGPFGRQMIADGLEQLGARGGVNVQVHGPLWIRFVGPLPEVPAGEE